MYVVAIEGRYYAKTLGNDIYRVYVACGAWTMALWFIYPICWGLGAGSDTISVDAVHIWYGILDLLAKPVFSLILLWGHRNHNIARLGLHVRGAEESPLSSSTHGAHHEKGSHGDQNDGVTESAVESSSRAGYHSTV